MNIGQDIIDSRDIIARVEELEGELDTLEDQLNDAEVELDDDRDNEELEEAVEDARQELEEWREDNEEELDTLKAVIDEVGSYGDFSHGEALINEDHFEQYAQDLAEDIGAVNRQESWPYDCIDWSAAADALRQDYTSVEIDGHTYLMRA